MRCKWAEPADSIGVLGFSGGHARDDQILASVAVLRWPSTTQRSGKSGGLTCSSYSDGANAGGPSVNWAEFSVFARIAWPGFAIGAFCRPAGLPASGR